MASRLSAPAHDSVPPPPQPTKLRQGFVALAEALLKSLSEVFPECDEVDSGLHLFCSLVKGDPDKEDQFIRHCNSVFQKHSDSLKKREDEALFRVSEDIPILKEVDIRSKWRDAGFDDASKDNLWQYLQSLKLYSELFCAVPTGVMGKIESVAMDLGERLKKGEIDLSRMDIAGIGNELLGKLSQEEMKTFEGNLPSIYSSITEMASSFTRQTGHPDFNMEELMQKVVSAQSPSGAGVDLGSVMQRIGGLVNPGLGEGGEFNPQALMGLAQNLGPMLAQMQKQGGGGGDFPFALQEGVAEAAADVSFKTVSGEKIKKKKGIKK
jgi:hypothetical protein